MSENDSSPNSKVAWVIETYDLTGMGEKLEAAWTGESGERTSLRDLADEFNREVLRTAIKRAGTSAIDRDIENTYHILTSDDISDADTIRKERELQKEGVDIESVRSDFVTHQAIHTYLTKHRQAVFSDRSEDQPERNIKTIQRLTGRVQAVVESTIDQMIQNNSITNREYKTLVNVTVICPECGTDYPVVRLLREGGCDCE